MKKILVIILVITMFTPINLKAEELIPNAKQGLLMEISTGEIVFEKNIHERVAVASMTKMMSQIIILENIEKGNIKWNQKIKVSSNAAGFGGSQIYLQPNEVMTVKDLFKGVSMASANDATVALAETIAGTEEEFVKQMNQKAKEYELKNTNFMNSTGLDEENHYSSAYDMGVIARKLLEHEQILEYSSLYEDYLRVDTPNKFWLVNTNKLVRLYEGADGLKTGHTDAAKYCMAVTAKRNNMRLLAIVLGEETAKVRNEETTNLLDYGFNMYKIKLIHKKDEIIDKINIEKANEKEIKIYPKKDITILEKKTDVNKKYDTKIEIDELSLPLKEKEKVGKITILNENKPIKEIDLIVKENIKKNNFITLYLHLLQDISTG